MQQILISLKKNSIYISLSEIVSNAIVEILARKNEDYELVQILHFSKTDFIVAPVEHPGKHLKIIFRSGNFSFEKEIKQ
jgi:hypothetical protein